MASLRFCAPVIRSVARVSHRRFASATAPLTSPRHLLSIADLTPAELTTLVLNAASHKKTIKSGTTPKNIAGALTGKLVGMTFNKRSTRTRISTEGAVVAMGGHPMFLGKDDIQLGVNESLYDTSVVMSSMMSCIVARVGPHSDVADLAKHSSVPVINALSDWYHPLQTIADFLTLHEAFPSDRTFPVGLDLAGRKIAWVGDANNVLFDLALGAVKLGVDVAVATPKGYGIPKSMRDLIAAASEPTPTPGKITEHDDPLEAVYNANILATDTWISMGQESEKQKRLRDFAGFQITEEMGKRGGAKPDWKFMHCLPRHQEEVADEVFYGSRSLVFQEAENRLWAAIGTFWWIRTQNLYANNDLAAIEAFVVNKGEIR
ncbi:ornithine carbamoyl transferase precursor [Eremomyces bilateralis CBS 781.70]|uniref:Ornithine carbamoyltransferase, mitochondrial n=1 Tax=Eremomyces bilateralis CBS 781.70 TaxID=1392243 RepID=A0A6G1FVT2_9PEZI|nr:ornithine carbamoyl transferase precursor [Eremomyces bilateralis CBS 781.70]KAF1809937.1 ornithine carbamoyl transferase precursor [Eremomyces bilateralis CBS 781.70]